MNKIAVTTLLAVFATVTAAQTIYQCEDENGRKVFSQMPCAPTAEVLKVDVPQLTPEEEKKDRGRIFFRLC